MKKEEYITEHFPAVEAGVKPFGTRVLVQLRTVKEKTKSGIVLVEETKQFNNETTVIGRIVAKGNIAYCNRETGLPWPEGVWCEVGEIVLCPKYGGLRFSRPIPGQEGEVARFAVFQDHEIICGIRDGFDDIDQIL